MSLQCRCASASVAAAAISAAVSATISAAVAAAIPAAVSAAIAAACFTVRIGTRSAPGPHRSRRQHGRRSFKVLKVHR